MNSMGISVLIYTLTFSLCFVIFTIWLLHSFAIRCSKIEHFKKHLHNEPTEKLTEFYNQLEEEYKDTTERDTGRRMAILDCQRTIQVILSHREKAH